MAGRRPGRLGRRLLRAPTRLYDWNAGWLLGRRFLRLTHIGRRTGRRHRTMLEVIGTRPADEEFVVIAGLGRSAEWYRNLQAHGAVEVAVGRQRFRPEHRILSDGEGHGCPGRLRAPEPTRRASHPPRAQLARRLAVRRQCGLVSSARAGAARRRVSAHEAPPHDLTRPTSGRSSGTRWCGSSTGELPLATAPERR